jgi:hypothetical protein
MGLMAEVQRGGGGATPAAPAPGPLQERTAVSVSPPPRRPPVLTFARKILLSLMGLGVISAIVGGTMQNTRSSFTATVANPANSFAVGTLKMTNGTCTGVVASYCGAFTFSAGKLQPGMAYPKLLTIANSGTLPAMMSLQIQNVQDVTGTLSGHVNITIHDDSQPACLYGTAGAPAGTACDALTNAALLDGFAGIPASIQIFGLTRADHRWEPAESHNITFTVEIDPVCPGTPSSLCDGWQTAFDVVWSGAQ